MISFTNTAMTNWTKKFAFSAAAAVLVICLSLGMGNIFGGIDPTDPTEPFQTGTEPTDTQPSEPRPDDVLSVDWKMTASVIQPDGTVVETYPMTANGTIEEEAPFIYPKLDIKLEGDFRFVFKIAEPDGDISTNGLAQWPGDYTTNGSCYDKTVNKPAPVAWAVNTQKEYFIAWFGEEYGMYVVAATDPAVQPDEILAHFELFVERYKPTDPEPTDPEPTDPELIIPDQFPDDLITGKASLAAFQSLFDTNEWFRHALCDHYEDPRNMSLHRFFYDSSIVDDRGIFDDDRAAIVAKTGVEDFYNRKAYRLSAEKMDEVLKEIYGISLNEVDEGYFYSLHYLESNGDYCYFDHSMPPISKVNVLGIRILENGNTEVYYTAKRAIASYPTEYGVLTLRNVGEGYQVLANHDIEIWPEPGYVPQIPEGAPADLNTDEEVVLKFQRLFYNDSWYTQALLEEYDDPRDITLKNFLFDSAKRWPFKHLTVEERNEIAKLLGVDVKQWGDITGMKAATMEEVVQKVFGLSLADFTDSAKQDIRYLESTGYYYYGDNDCTTVFMVAVAGIRELENGNVEVYYTAGGPGPLQGFVTLKPVGDSYIVIANTAL